MLTDAQVYCMTSMIYLFRPPLTAKPSIGKRRKQSCTPNIIIVSTSIYCANFIRSLFIITLAISYSILTKRVSKDCLIKENAFFFCVKSLFYQLQLTMVNSITMIAIMRTKHRKGKERKRF